MVVVIIINVLWICSAPNFEQRKKSTTTKDIITIDENDKTKVFGVTFNFSILNFCHYLSIDA